MTSTAPAQYINDTLPSCCRGVCLVGLVKYVGQHDRECNAQAIVTHTYLSTKCVSASVDQQVRQQETVQAIDPSNPCLRAFAA